MFRRSVLVFFLAIFSLALTQNLPSKKHTVIALLVKNGNHSTPPDVQINGQKIMNKNLAAPAVVPQQGTKFQGPLPQGPPPQGPQLAAAMQQNNLPPKPVAPLVKPLAEPPLPPAQILIKPKDKPVAVEKKKKVKDELLPCDDYSPICHYYGKDAQCRDVWMQRHCRKFCGLCDVPIGVFLGCVDMKHCHQFGKSACMHDWVKKTCKAKCGQCGYSREAASNILIGKKRGSVLKSKEETNQEKNQHTDDVKKASVLTNTVAKQEKPIPVPARDTEGSTGSGSAADMPFDDEVSDDDDVNDDDDDDVDDGDNDDDDEDDDSDDDENEDASGSGHFKSVRLIDIVKPDNKNDNKKATEVKKTDEKSDKVVAKVTKQTKSLKMKKSAGKKAAKRMFLKHKPCRRS